MDFFDSRGRRSRSQNVSEQRRALLLPQEVKELGTEEAIICYEGLRPIRCHKIRYFSDRRFRERLFPPPTKPAPGWELPSNQPLEESSAPAEGGVVGSSGAESAPRVASPTAEANITDAVRRTREANVEDLEHVDTLTLEDFATDFSKVQIPQHEGPLSAQEMNAAVESFLNTLRER